MVVVPQSLRVDLIDQQHNGIRDAITDQVRCESIVSDSTIEPAEETVVVDLSVMGVWLA